MMVHASMLVFCCAFCLAFLWSTQGSIIDNNACDRSCRYTFDFFNRSITGERVGALSNPDFLGSHCKCYFNGSALSASLVERKIPNKEYDPDSWTGFNNYTTTKLCVLRAQRPVTIDSIGHKADNDTLLHCGKCGACSDIDDLAVINNTKGYITVNMTICAAAFASPLSQSKGDLGVLRKCLRASGINFTTDGRAWDAKQRSHLPTCMDCWTDNIMNDAVYCNKNPDCIYKFFNPSNSGALQGCLECDEKHSGAEFIKCAGSNRRSSGIKSDIDRHPYEICKHGYFSQI